MEIRVISQYPPGGRCTLYAGYAEALASLPGARVEVAFTALRDAHGTGYPSLLLDGAAVAPADGVILMPADIFAALSGLGIDAEALVGLAEILEAPLERMLEGEPRAF